MRREEQCCQNCNFQKNGICLRYPPGLVSGPLVVKEPVDLPKLIPLEPSTALLMDKGADIYRVLVGGWPQVAESDWCGEWRVLQ